MNRADLLPTLLRIAREATDESDLDFDAETRFVDIEEWDSLNHIHIIVRIEEVFGIHFDDASRLHDVKVVQDLLDIIADLKGL